jgi:uncharacterized protein YjcR
LANSKKEAFYEMAERMFVMEGYTREDIAKRLDLGEKTVRNWAIEGGWEAKKAQARESIQATHLEIYEVIRVVGQALRMDAVNGKVPSAAQINAFRNLVESAPQLKKYEDAVRTEKVAEEQKKNQGDGTELLRTVNEILGIQ